MGAFERVAEIVTERTSELLGAEVSVVDDRGVVVMSSSRGLAGRLLDRTTEVAPDVLSVPLRLQGQQVEIIVSHPTEEEGVPPRLARILIDLIVNQTAVVDRLPNKGELKNKLIHDLLHGSIADETETIREAQILGMDLTVPRTVILIDAAQYILPSETRGQEEARTARAMRRAQLVIGSVVDFFDLPNDGICAYIGNGEVAVLKASNRQSLRAWTSESERNEPLNPSWASLSAVKVAGAALLTRLRSTTHTAVNIGIGRYHPGLLGLERSYQDARAALSLGKRYGGSNQVYCLDSLGIAAFVGVADEGTKIDLAHYLLSPLDHEPMLMRTLTAFLAHDLSPLPASRELSIHRNTLAYRLDKITSLVGLDPRRFDDAVQLRLSLVLRSLGGERAQEPDGPMPALA